MSDSTGRRATRCMVAAAVALLIALVATATSSGQPQKARTRTTVRAALMSSRLSSILANRGLHSAGAVASYGDAVNHRGAKATAAGTPCGNTPGLLCATVVVPLDRTGVVPGTVSLHVETLPALGTPRGAMFLIAGGPGQGSAHVFGLGSPSAVALFRYLFPGYTLVAYDDRGTGASGVLRCPALQNSTTFDVNVEGQQVAACAGGLGSGASFFSTHEHAEDLEAVRQALGVDKVALWGTSYGTKLALAYALAHPDHVERLLLNSVVPPELPDPYDSDVLRAMPATLSAFCAGGFCSSATSDFPGELVKLANQLAAKPIEIKTLQPDGSRKVQRINGAALLFLTVESDLSPGIAAELPAAVHAALHGNYPPVLRLLALDTQASIVPDEDLSSGLYAATTCRDGNFPWSPDTPPAARPALLAAAIKALPPGSLGPFGPWAAEGGTASFCLQWPSPAGGAALATGPLPDVPVLAVSGGFDMRTPTGGASDVISRFRQGHLLVVPGVGHDAIDADLSFCAAQAVHDWMLGGQPASSCPRPNPIMGEVPAYPSGTAPKVPATPRRTVALTAQALQDAEAIWLITASGDSVAGVYGGRLQASGRGFTLVNYSVSPGVRFNGKVRVTGTGLPVKFEGVVTVSGPSVANGILGVSPGKLGGTLNGTIVS